MKKVLFFLMMGVIFSLSSCRPSFTQVAYYLDYQQAGKGKVFISEANSVSFEYEPLGSILIEELPGVVKVSNGVTDSSKKKGANYKSNDDDIYSKNTSLKSKNQWQYASAQSALDYAADAVINLGGDGLINVKLSSYIDKHNNKIVQVSGMVIKRK